MTGQGWGREDLKVANVAIGCRKLRKYQGEPNASYTAYILGFWGSPNRTSGRVGLEQDKKKKLEGETEKWNNLKQFETFCAVGAWRHQAGGKKTRSLFTRRSCTCMWTNDLRTLRLTMMQSCGCFNWRAIRSNQSGQASKQCSLFSHELLTVPLDEQIQSKSLACGKISELDSTNLEVTSCNLIIL